MLFASQRSFIAKKAFEISRHPVMAASVGWTFEYAAQLLPVKRIYLTPNVIGFYHPAPAWQTHILMIPRKAIKDVFMLLNHENENYFSHVLKASRSVVESEFASDTYTLIVNGGIRQDVPQVHFHLNQQQGYVQTVLQRPSKIAELITVGDLSLFLVDNETLPYRFLILSKETTEPISKITKNYQYSSELRELLQFLEAEYSILAQGYSLVFQELSEFEKVHMVINVLVGGRLETDE